MGLNLRRRPVGGARTLSMRISAIFLAAAGALSAISLRRFLEAAGPREGRQSTSAGAAIEVARPGARMPKPRWRFRSKTRIKADAIESRSRLCARARPVTGRALRRGLYVRRAGDR